MKSAPKHRIRLGGRLVNYRLSISKGARKLRVRVGPKGVEVVQPAGRSGEEVSDFLTANANWVLDQLDRVMRLQSVIRVRRRRVGVILFRGKPTPVRIGETRSQASGNTIRHVDGKIVIQRGLQSQTSIARSLENWLRREARQEIENHLSAVTARIGQLPQRVYIMDQRTKWGNCSSLRNLSFNWRLILAPDYVLRYIVTHEAVHLAIPDHSAKFWLTVQSLCPETERARQWLCSRGADLRIDLALLNTGP